MLNKTFLTKSDAWEYEKEWRIIKQKLPRNQKDVDKYLEPYMDKNSYRLLTDHRGAGIYSFDPTAVESITMGLLISRENEKFVINSVREATCAIPLYKAVKDQTRYKISRSLLKIDG